VTRLFPGMRDTICHPRWPANVTRGSGRASHAWYPSPALRFAAAGMTFLLFSLFGQATDAANLAPSYQEVCKAGEHPKWAYGKAETPIQLQALFGCDKRFGARRDADERYVEQLQKRGLQGAALSWELVRQGWKWVGARKLPSALNRFNLAFEADPGNGDVFHGIAVVMAETGQPSEVVDYWFAQGVAQERGQPGRFADYGRFLNMQGRAVEALPVLQRSLELEPQNAWTMINLASLHFHQKNKPAACAMIGRLAKAQPPPGYPKERFAKVIDGWLKRGADEGC
jgi:tetratricopeptide (TPR) repeat protein